MMNYETRSRYTQMIAWTATIIDADVQYEGVSLQDAIDAAYKREEYSAETQGSLGSVKRHTDMAVADYVSREQFEADVRSYWQTETLPYGTPQWQAAHDALYYPSRQEAR